MKRKKYGKLIPQEKNRKVIKLERRGHKIRRHTLPAVLSGVTGVSCILYCGGIALFGFGTYFFLIWGCMGVLFLIICAALSSRRVMEALPGWLKILCAILFFGGLLLFGIVEGMILSQYNAQAAPGADYCIILGAQWKDSGPSVVLRKRLDKAVEYLKQNPDTKVIVSGGQGSNEIMAEAVGMRGYLMEAGIAEERILVEDKSVNTCENLVFSGRLLNPQNDSVVIVTNNFHVFRALKIAEKQGYARVEGLAAHSRWEMAPNNLLREFLGVVKDFLMGNL